jgi:hypothetical protein
MKRGPAIVIAVLMLSACASSHHSAKARIVTSATGPRGAAVTCAGETTTVRHLRSPTGSVWVWIESASYPSLRVGSLVKVVWRITGVGAPHAALFDPHRRAAKLAFGPELHPTSTFRHPGAEYGTGFTPISAGCWQLSMRRGSVAASVSFAVAD